jgi:hypothetical protein
MRRSVRYRSFADALVLLASCVLLQSVSEMRARASCGDWLAHSATSDGREQQATSGTDSDALNLNLADGVIASSQDSSPMPCDGPSCRNAPSSPAPFVPVPQQSTSDKLVLAGQDVVREPLSRWTFAARDSSAHAFRGFPVDIEHPPRA